MVKVMGKEERRILIVERERRGRREKEEMKSEVMKEGDVSRREYQERIKKE